MLATSFLHNQLKKSSTIHSKQLETLFLAVEATYKTSMLSLTGLGRRLASNAQTNSNINRMDRLLGNTKLHHKKNQVYAFLNHLLFSSCKRPNISVDWSTFVHGDKLVILRASLSMKGRSFTVYEKTYDIEDYNTPKTHRDFLKSLKDVLPKDCRPIITTDAGFSITWFKDVSRMGWDFVGRIRNNTLFRMPYKKNWRACVKLYNKASSKPQYMGNVILSKKHEYSCHLYLVKKKKKGRVKLNLRGKRFQTSQSKKSASRERDPWILVSSLSTQKPHEVINLYKQRMQIEESFRDTKSARYGFGLNESRSRSKERIDILLLIIALACTLSWLVGLAARRQNLAKQYQAQRVDRLVLSVVFLGRQILADGAHRFRKHDYIQSIEEFASIAN